MACRTILEVVLLGCAVTTTLAAVAVGPAETHPKHEGKCWSTGLGQAFGVGQAWQEEATCVRLTCGTHRGSLVVHYSTCGAVQVESPCRVEKGDTRLPYPKCCFNIVCTTPDLTPDTTSSVQKPSGIDHDALLLSPAEAAKDPEYEEFTNWINEYYDQPGAAV